VTSVRWATQHGFDGRLRTRRCWDAFAGERPLRRYGPSAHLLHGGQREFGSRQGTEQGGFGLITSLEASYRFDLGGGWAIEPQAQLVYQNLSFDDGADSFGFIDTTWPTMS
jgi:hypothetical protein